MCWARRNTRRLYTRMPSNTPSPYRRPWSNTEILASARSWYVPSIQTIGGMGRSAREGDDLVEDGPREVLVPGDGALARHHLDAGVAVFGLEGDAHVPLPRGAVHFPLLPLVVLFGRGLGRGDLELFERPPGGAGHAVHRGGHDRLDAPLSEVDAAARAGAGRGHHAPAARQAQRQHGRPHPARRAVLPHRHCALLSDAANIPARPTLRLPRVRPAALLARSRTAGPGGAILEAWTRRSDGRGSGRRPSGPGRPTAGCVRGPGIPW